MSTDQLVSVTDLRKQPNKILKMLIRWPKFIVVNNKMEGVMISTTDYDYFQYLKKLQEFHEDMDEALQNSKTYDNVEDLFRDALID